MFRSSLASLLVFISISRVPAQPVTLVNAFPNLSFTRPVLVTHAGDGSGRVFVVQQNGLIRVFPNDSAVTSGSASTFLNITNRLSSTTGEEGLLGLAFHPDYETNGYFYINYTAPSPLRTVVSRFSVTPGNPNRADSLSEVVLLTINQPYSNHNGGMILFGTDGYLYIGTGDGGSGGDPDNNAQNINSLLGKILRIDVDTTTAVPYGIPADNPFVGIPGADEIFAWGMRNPWRFSQDPMTGQIWAGDVGQGTWEEVDLIEVGRNYGWRCYEGNDPYNTTGCGPLGQYTFPVKQYSSASPNPECSVVGGYVYRGYRRPELAGAYIYGDYCSGKIWKFRYQGIPVTYDSLVVDAPFSLTSFGTDELGELYMCNYSSGTIHRFAGAPATLTTALVSPANGQQNVPIPAALFWRTASGASAYWLELADNAGFAGPIVNDSTLTDTSASATGLSSGTRYFWRVRVRNAVGWGSGSPVWTFTTLPAPPAVPSLVSPPDFVTSLAMPFAFVWRAAVGAASYRVHIAGDSLFGLGIQEIPSVADTSVEIAEGTFPGATQFFWRVRAENAGGVSGWSSVWRFTTLDVITGQYSVPAGWSLISLPLAVGDRRVSSLFPEALSAAYAFVPPTGYLPRDTMKYGEGYWIKFDTTGGVSISGGRRDLDTVDVLPGWNMIGSLTTAVDTGSVLEIPTGLLQSAFFDYTGAYVPADSLRPLRGYWVRAGNGGQIVLSAPAPGRLPLPAKPR